MGTCYSDVEICKNKQSISYDGKPVNFITIALDSRGVDSQFNYMDEKAKDIGIDEKYATEIGIYLDNNERPHIEIAYNDFTKFDSFDEWEGHRYANNWDIIIHVKSPHDGFVQIQCVNPEDETEIIKEYYINARSITYMTINYGDKRNEN